MDLVCTSNLGYNWVVGLEWNNNCTMPFTPSSLLMLLLLLNLIIASIFYTHSTNIIINISLIMPVYFPPLLKIKWS